LLYRFDSGLAPYVSYSTAFTPTNFVDAQGDLLNPMEGRQIEAGVKYQAPGQRSSYGIAVFNIRQKNVATKEQPTDPYRSVGEIESEGVELEVNTWLTQRLNLLASYTYNDIRYSKSDDGNQGNRAVYAPKHLASVWASYRHAGALQGLDTALGWRYASGIVSDRANTYVLPSYGVLDLALGYDFEALGVRGLSTRLNVQNLLDKKYVAACNSLEFCYYGAERTVTLSVSYKF
jgi:iron complex outermembrane receptor protein